MSEFAPLTIGAVLEHKAQSDAKPKPRELSTIAYEIRRTWKPVYFGAVPYLDAMTRLHSITDKFGYDDARSIVLYFLSNARTWRGPDAKRIKAELNAMLKGR